MKLTLSILIGLAVVASSASVGGGRGLSAMALTVQNDAMQDFMTGIQTFAKVMNEPRCPEPYFPVNDECFYINHLKLKWSDAKIACEQMEGHLAEPENVFLLYYYLKEKLGPEVVYFFIGGKREPRTAPSKFLSGRPINDAEWAPNNPHGREGEDCLVIMVEYPPIADFYCERIHESICEYGPPQRVE